MNELHPKIIDFEIQTGGNEEWDFKVHESNKLKIK